MKKILQRGFTLIELLVVIAIIGILAAVVLASLNDARDGGRDASAKGSMNAIRNQMELRYNNNNFAYTGGCAIVQTAFQATIISNTPATAMSVALATPSSATNAACHENADSYAASTPLNTTPLSYFCVDSTGKAIVTTNELAASELACT